MLGANDGIVSTASLIIGVAAAGTPSVGILVAGTAGLVAGAMSMAAGEYVSVSSQSDVERAELALERRELADDPSGECAELAAIYERRGVDPATADAVARQLMEKDALGAHAQDELGLSAITSARPVQAAFASAASFTIGAALPLATVMVAPAPSLVVSVALASLIFLATLGVVGAVAGGAPTVRAAARVTFWGVLAMAATALIGHFVGTAI